MTGDDTGREQDIGAGERIPEDERSPVRQFEMGHPDLLLEALERGAHRVGSLAVDLLQPDVLAHDVEGGCVQFCHGEETPLVVSGPLGRAHGRHQSAGPAIGFAKIGDDGRAFRQDQIPVLEQRNLFPGVEPDVLGALGLARAGPDGPSFVFQPQLL